ncbi:MAG TPA: FHA domain-containing protein [Isosphaeraceae bacterium]|nr:FHA domain-containing protein [Isosphaeraceae bacterium]
MDHFLKACGAAGPLRLIVEMRGLPGAVQRSFSQPFVLIGRDPRTDLFLDHPRVSRRHASLQMIEGRVYCVDLASRTGTRWEDGPARSGWLERPSGICVGPFAIQLEHDSDPTSSLAHGQAEPMDPLVTRPSDRDDLPRVVLEFPRESSRLLQWRMNCALALVGNSPHCKVRLLDPSVSGFHCSLVRMHEGMWVVNLLGRGGITVNRASVRSARLEDGDELRVGEIPIRICCESSASKAREAVPAPSKAERTTTLVVSESIPGELMPRPWEIAWPSPIRQAGGMLAAGSSSETELTRTALAMFLNQFGQMQRQMLDQFQQSTMMMFQMFGSMHTEQMEMIREELARLREIGETLESLKAEVKTATERAERPALGPTPWGPSPATPSIKASARAEAPGNGTRGVIPASGPPSGDGAAAGVGAGRQPTPGGTSKDQPLEPSPNVDAWLFDRISALQEEQQSRWQKIFTVMRGKS